MQKLTPWHWLDHALLASAVGIVANGVLPICPFMIYLGSAIWGVREFYQYFIQGKRHKGRFDYEGFIAPVLAGVFLDAIIPGGWL